MKAQQLNGRRGAVFSVRVTEEERAALELLQAEGGPRALGPWLVWRALSRDDRELADAQRARLEGIAESIRALVDELAPTCRRELTATAATPATVVPRRRGTARARVLPARAGTTAAENRDRHRGTTPPSGYYPRDRLILDLCAGSGAWSAPYEAAGYRVLRVSLPDCDVRTFRAPLEPVWGVLAAPPCDQFSLARNGHTETPRDFVRGLECVNACLRIIFQVAPRWWALENPVGLLSKWLGTPRDVFEPCDFGDPWTKRTAIWGSFAMPRRGPFVRPVGGGPLCELCDPERRRSTWCSNPAHRAITPAGFARAFFEANP